MRKNKKSSKSTPGIGSKPALSKEDLVKVEECFEELEAESPPLAIPEEKITEAATKSTIEHYKLTAELATRSFKAAAEEVENLQCRIARIMAAIAERLNQDGVDDIILPNNKMSKIFWLLTYGGAIIKLIKEIVEIIKDKTPCKLDS